MYIRTPPAPEPMHRPLYNQLVPYYEIIEGRNWQSEIELITSFLRKHESEYVVDLGCGTGYHVRALAKLGFEAVGIDISKQNIRFAKGRAKQKVHPRFVVGSYYEYRSDEIFDAALCLNWSIPVKDNEVKRFLDNTYSLLRPEGLLIFDYERVSQIVWSDVGKAITESWDLGDKLIVRVSLGQVISNVLSSRDIYILYSKSSKLTAPSEPSRYRAPKGTHVQTYVDSSYVRFFSVSEIRDLAQHSGFKIIADLMIPRKKYRRHYAVLMKIH
jgi:SAM-dependent methyltransferase